MWKINGIIYDLNSFLDLHPGGRSILESCIGEDDLTATFESYHSMVNMDKIKKTMKKYEIGKYDYDSCNPSFNENGFYRTLQKRVKLSLGKNTKSNLDVFFKSSLQTIIFSLSFFYSFYCHSFGLFYRIFFAALSGHMALQMLFCIMHDASHMAISKNKYINDFLTDTISSINLWDGKLWMQHHVFRHHAFTGDYNLDPDMIHFKPFVRKSSNIDSKRYLKISNSYPISVALFTICLFPGMLTGQGLMYHLVWLRKKYLWGMKLSSLFRISLFQSFVKLFMLFSFFYGQSLFVFLAYTTSMNITYAMFILPDHDMFETNSNKIEELKNKDWGEIQVRHSGNFSNQNRWLSSLFGGINHQIEHHLFPTLCHIHLPKIKPIVEKTCKEFNIPYVHNSSIFSAVYSTLKQYSSVSKKK